MSIENELLSIKKKLAKTENEIARNDGRLSGLYDDLRSALDLPKSASKDKIIKAGNTKIQSLKKQIKKDEDTLEELMEEIQEEIQTWEDEDEDNN